MMDEIVFPRKKRTIATIVGAFLLVQALVGILQFNWVLSGGWVDAAVVELVLVGLCAGLLYPFVNQRYVEFFPNGIGYLRLFRRRFLPWGEINAVSNCSFNQLPVLRLAGETNSVDIFLGEFVDRNEVVRFIDERLNAANDPQRVSLQTGLLQHMLAEDVADVEAFNISSKR